jgi:hypothetical protein
MEADKLIVSFGFVRGESYYYRRTNGAWDFASVYKVPFAVSPNTWYMLRLEVAGDQLRAFINDRFLMEASDTSHAAGKYGLVTYRAAATFDDVRVLEP